MYYISPSVLGSHHDLVRPHMTRVPDSSQPRMSVIACSAGHVQEFDLAERHVQRGTAERRSVRLIVRSM